MTEIQQTQKDMIEIVKFLDENLTIVYEGKYRLKVITENRAKAKRIEIDLIHGGTQWAVKKHFNKKKFDNKLVHSVVSKWVRKNFTEQKNNVLFSPLPNL